MRASLQGASLRALTAAVVGRHNNCCFRSNRKGERGFSVLDASLDNEDDQLNEDVYGWRTAVIAFGRSQSEWAHFFGCLCQRARIMQHVSNAMKNIYAGVIPNCQDRNCIY
ncbi:unnamed protein product [Sphagnum tenellum]